MIDTARQEMATNLIHSAPRQGRQKSNRRTEGPCRNAIGSLLAQTSKGGHPQRIPKPLDRATPPIPREGVQHPPHPPLPGPSRLLPQSSLSCSAGRL